MHIGNGHIKLSVPLASIVTLLNCNVLFSQTKIEEFAKERLASMSIDSLQDKDKQFFSNISDEELTKVIAGDDKLLSLQASWESSRREITRSGEPRTYEQVQSQIRKQLDIIAQGLQIEIPQYWRWFWGQKRVLRNGLFGPNVEINNAKEMDHVLIETFPSTNANQLVFQSTEGIRYTLGFVNRLTLRGGELEARTKDGSLLWTTRVISEYEDDALIIGTPSETLSIHLTLGDSCIYVWGINSSQLGWLVKLDAKSGAVLGYYTLGPEW